MAVHDTISVFAEFLRDYSVDIFDSFNVFEKRALQDRCDVGRCPCIIRLIRVGDIRVSFSVHAPQDTFVNPNRDFHARRDRPRVFLAAIVLRLLIPR